MSELTSNEIIIQGLTKNGRPFRPSDWAERLSGALSTFGEDHRMYYSPYVRPMTINGVKCVVVERELQQKQPTTFSFLMNFARENDLQILDGAEVGKQEN